MRGEVLVEEGVDLGKLRVYPPGGGCRVVLRWSVPVLGAEYVNPERADASDDDAGGVPVEAGVDADNDGREVGRDLPSDARA
jgi:hypothetical protein